MEKRLLLLVVVLMVVVLCASSALALSPMGPPTAGLKKGQWSAGVDYSYSKMDLKLNEGKGLDWQAYHAVTGALLDTGTDPLESVTVKNAKVNTVLAKLGYGITDNWEAFLGLGGANVDYKIDEDKYNGDTGFAIGFGTKATFWEQTPDLKWGGLFQIGWAQSDAKLSGVDNGETWSETLDLDITEIQIAVGPTYKLRENVSLYGGPFLHFIDGDVDIKYSGSGEEGGVPYVGRGKGSYDIDESSIFGGYIGAQIDVVENLPFYIEWQHTEHADALCVSLAWRF